jgi:hypothetical protein
MQDLAGMNTIADECLTGPVFRTTIRNIVTASRDLYRLDVVTSYGDHYVAPWTSLDENEQQRRRLVLKDIHEACVELETSPTLVHRQASEIIQRGASWTDPEEVPPIMKAALQQAREENAHVDEGSDD